MIRGTYLKKICLCFLVILLITLFLVNPKKAQAQDNDYPKLANYYNGWDVAETDIPLLAKWDIVILSPQAQERNPQILVNLKKANPSIKILVYISIEDISNEPQVIAASPFFQKLYNEVDKNNWWLKSPNGEYLSWWPKNWIINATSAAPKTTGQNWSEFLPEIINNEFLQNSQWDGVFYDNMFQEITWINKPIDINNDGVGESNDLINQKWQEGLINIVNKTKQLAPNKLVAANTSSNFYNNQLNGRMQENFPAANEGGWSGSMKNYLQATPTASFQYFIINANTANSGTKEDYATFRFGLTSTLLGDGYYSFDYGDAGHDRIWWYDEYNFYLGKSVNSIQNLLEPTSREIKPGVWKRDFQNAVVIVNSTAESQKITLNEEYEKIKGTQDTDTNNGAIIKTLTLRPKDGIILLRRVEDVKDTPYVNGSFVRVFNKYGDSVRNGFFLYEKQFKGREIVAKMDINNDGQREIIVANTSKITIYDSNKNPLTTFYPYGSKYNYGLNIALNDFENDGFLEIVTGSMKGYGPEVRVFNYKGQQQGQGFNAYAPGYKGGVTVAVCDLVGNNQKQIVTGTGFMGGPQVRIFDKNGKVLSGGFFAYSKTFRGGVNVACGDIDGNKIDEIVTGAGYGGSSHVRYFNSKFEPLSPGFWAFGKDSRTGVKIFISDLDNDGIEEILTGSPDTFTTAFNR